MGPWDLKLKSKVRFGGAPKSELVNLFVPTFVKDLNHLRMFHFNDLHQLSRIPEWKYHCVVGDVLERPCLPDTDFGLVGHPTRNLHLKSSDTKIRNPWLCRVSFAAFVLN